MKNQMIQEIAARILTVLAIAGSSVSAQLPADFPQLSILPNTNPAPGDFFGSLSVSGVPGVSSYFAILDNARNPVLLNKTNSFGNLACNGLFVTTSGTNGQSIAFQLKDSSFNVLATIQAGSGYTADNQDFEVLPNGHALILIYDSTPVVDMSKLVPGGFPAALPTQSVIQEVDVDGNVVFQWRSLDHIPVTDSYQTLTNANLGDYIHVNSVWFDDTDGNLILSCRNTSEVIKISRVTGDILWRMQGKHNQFTFTNAIAGNTDPAGFQVQHNARRLANGDLTVFDNGYSAHSDPAYHFTRPYTRAVEYAIDEVNKTAKLVWEFRHTPDLITYNGGSVQRLPGGHTVIQWGNNNTAAPALAMTEADATGKLVCDVALPQPGVTGSFTRQVWPLESTDLNVTQYELTASDTYVFNLAPTVTGVTLDVATLDGDLYNHLTVSRQPFAPVLPRFLSTAPRVVPVRVLLSPESITAIGGQLSFDVISFGLKDPTNTTVYYRQTPGQGLFVPVPTQYNWVTHQLQAQISDFGEYIFGFPDLGQVPYPPLLIAPAQNASVNQALPVAFFWTPQGFVGDYNLQVATDADFASLVADEPGLTECRYTLPSLAANTRYYWRVNTENDGGASDWVTNSFTTAPPTAQMTVPSGGEAWERGLSYILQWRANLAENIALDLFKSGVFVKTITTNAPNIPAYTWQPGLTLVPGSDYAIKIRSTANAALSAMSGAFSIVDAPSFNPASFARLTNGRVQFGVSAPGAATATVMISTNLVNWRVFQTLGITNGTAVFTDAAPATAPSLFYRLRVP